MSDINLIKDSLEKFLINNISNAYVYQDTSYDLDRVFNCSPQSDVTDTTNSFVLYSNDYNSIFTSSDENFLVNRYAIINGAYVKITSYDNLTGEITLEDSFSLTTEDSIDIVVVDALLVKFDRFIDMDNSRSFNKISTVFDISITTKFDSKENKFMDIISSLKQAIGNSRTLPLKDTDISIRFQNNGYFTKVANQSSDLMEGLFTITLEHYADNRL